MRTAIEAVVLLITAVLPWAFGGVDTFFEFLLAVSVSLLLVLWATLSCVNGRATWVRCYVAPCLLGIFALGAFQLLPIPNFALRLLSPGTAHAVHDFMPTEPEQLSETVAAPSLPSARPISVNPHATRIELVHWLTALILFAVVRNQIASTESFQRLGAVVLVNGVLLTIFGLIQLISKRDNSVFGHPTTGTVFGPFINRNHAAAYLSMSIAMSTGLFLLLSSRSGKYSYEKNLRTNASASIEDQGLSRFSPFRILSSPLELWMIVGISIMCVGLIGSQSRGGAASFAVALLTLAGIKAASKPKWSGIELFLLPLLLIFGLLAFLDISPLHSRLAHLFSSSAFEDSRWTIWKNLLKIWPSFPLFGAGYGTLNYVEPLARSESDFGQLSDLIVDHAHNDYLEALVEGGIIRFALTIAAVAITLVIGYRGLRRYDQRTPGFLAFGGLFAVLALAIHSFVDFSITTPAVAVLASVIAAQLVSLDRKEPTAVVSTLSPHVETIELGLLGKAVMAMGTLATVLALTATTWNADVVHRLKLGAFRALRNDPHLIDYPKAVEFLQTAVERDPDDGDLHVELGQLILTAARGTMNANSLNDVIVPAIEQMVLARQACPLIPRPHARLAAYASRLVKADPPEAYWKRALMLAPNDPDLWYFFGLWLAQANRSDEAYQAWKKSLSLRPSHLGSILDSVGAKLSVERMMVEFLPDSASVLAAAAEKLDPQWAADPSRVPSAAVLPLLKRASQILKEADGPDSASQMYLQARIFQALDERERALSSYRLALELRAPASLNRNPWRLQYAKLLHLAGKLDDAARELRILKELAPSREVDDELQIVDFERTQK